MSLETINVGVIGAAGKHAEWSHVEQLAQIDESQIEYLADISEDRLAAIALQYAPAARHSQRWEAIVEDPLVDAVFVMTPDDQHTSQLQAAITAGKHVFVEKPLANTWEDYVRVRSSLAEAQEKGLVVSSCHPRRFDPPFIATKQLLDNRDQLATMFSLDNSVDLGSVTAFGLNLNYSRPAKTGLHTSFASDHVPHEIDTASHFFGLSGLEYAISTVNRELEFDIEARREDGIALRFRGNRLQEQKGYREDWRIDFSSGATLSVDAHVGTVALGLDGDVVQRSPIIDGKPLFKTDYETRFLDLNRHFIRSIIGEPTETAYLSQHDMFMNTVVGLALDEVNKPVKISADGLVSDC